MQKNVYALYLDTVVKTKKTMKHDNKKYETALPCNLLIKT